MAAEREYETVFTDGKADAGRGWAAEGFGEAVVAASAENGILRAERAVRKLERGARVVVEAANEAVVYLETRHRLI